MPTGTIVIGFFPATQSPVDERYLNEGAPWTDEAEVLAGIPIGSRCPGLLVNIDGVIYMFSEDMASLTALAAGSLQDAEQVLIDDTGNLYDAANVEDALAEAMAAVNVLDAAVDAINTSGAINIYSIDLTAQTTVAARVAAATEGDDYPTGWTIAANSTTNLLVTHTLTGKKIVDVKVYEIDGSNERLLVPFNSSYSGILGNGLTVLIEGLAPTLLAIRIELIFK
jgi:hypothetical protein